MLKINVTVKTKYLSNMQIHDNSRQLQIVLYVKYRHVQINKLVNQKIVSTQKMLEHKYEQKRNH